MVMAFNGFVHRALFYVTVKCYCTDARAALAPSEEAVSSSTLFAERNGSKSAVGRRLSEREGERAERREIGSRQTDAPVFRFISPLTKLIERLVLAWCVYVVTYSYLS